ncbi:MAG: hypothetical protein JO215_01380 [Ktedonobacteraceae bacterium]|nr:hypothetical protein [Ktedonobacteraceae bacterium]
MKRFAFGSLLVCLLVLSSGLLGAARADAHPASGPGVQRSSTLSPISIAQLKSLVRRTLGQQAVDSMGKRVTQPLSISPSDQPALRLKPSKMAAAPRLQASAREYYGNSPTSAGYTIDAEGVSWVQGVGGFFNVPTADNAIQVATEIAVATSNGSGQISLGVTKNADRHYAVLIFAGGATWTLFSVSANDQMDAEIYLDGNTNKWLIFIEDLTTRQSYGNEFAYTTFTTLAGWETAISRGGPVPPMNLITFTNARWVSNWDGWQPITSSAAAAYAQWTLTAPNGGIISPTEIPDPPGTSFTLIPCPSCSS